jgi:hypothetical protein
MNQRIRKLVKQAGGHISMRNLASNPVQQIETVELWDDRIEKFAELIVRECAEVADKAEPYQTSDLILKHFGVAE